MFRLILILLIVLEYVSPTVAPSLSFYIPEKLTCIEDSYVQLNPIRIDLYTDKADDDNKYKLDVTITSSNGLFYIKNKNDVYIRKGNLLGNDTSYSLVGKLESIRTVLGDGSIWYYGYPVAANKRLNTLEEGSLVSSTVTISITTAILIWDAGSYHQYGTPVTRTSAVSLLAKNNAPTIDAPSTVGLNQTSYSTLKATIYDIDIVDQSTANFTAIVTAQYAALTISGFDCRTDTINFDKLFASRQSVVYNQLGNDQINVSSICTTTSSLNAINRGLATIIYKPFTKYNKLYGLDNMNIIVYDNGLSGIGGNMTSMSTTIMIVEPVNSVPT
jgi:hypothetical protein